MSLVPSPSLFSSLNPEQHSAAEHTEGPLLVLAGAGTGKTKVLTTRIANLILSRKAYPSEILAVTFTNKAAREMSERVTHATEGKAQGIWLGTFHSMSARILRRHAEAVGLKPSFTIIDPDDQLRMTKQLFREQGIDEKVFSPKLFLSILSRWKDKGLTPDRVRVDAGDSTSGESLPLYRLYQERLLRLNAVDFDDLILHNLVLFSRYPDILAEYHRKFRYVLVDEYQDTNTAQYLWLRALAESRRNLCCVGDDDQSIYGWRGAEVGNILRFERDFPGAMVVRLEQNYRSTTPILSAASHLISHNSQRLGKTLWTENPGDEPIHVLALQDDREEATMIASEIRTLLRDTPEDRVSIAVLVRAGFQTRAFEERFISESIQYRVVGGVRFYERQEIRDVVAYLRLLVEREDSLALERVIHVPKRGIGDATLAEIHRYAHDKDTSLFRAIELMLAENAFRPAVKNALTKFVNEITNWSNLLMESVLRGEATTDEMDEEAEHFSETMHQILRDSGYLAMWEAEDGEEAEARLENIREFLRALLEFPTPRAFLDHVSLVSDLDNLDETKMVTLMTLHAAKGLEFDSVFLPGWEEGLFPHPRSFNEGGAGLEEERRLAYVGLTRARKRAYISHAASRRVYHQWQHNPPSRFLLELPESFLEHRSSRVVPTFFLEDSPALSVSSFSSRSREVKPARIREANSNEIRSGDMVEHESFGRGIVLARRDSQVDVAFKSVGKKVILIDFVKRV